ncbi:uncharacterized protein UTRI_04811 [Ustilago trichophora]|uniref:Uncharacterized protein n=1 Tax=Ustilago trichophora TaxID=86804 RepID=A0A5C3ECL5_9BASI|nr:uncharacterized protein UTRI_04811 [Ustilago trichophora]
MWIAVAHFGCADQSKAQLTARLCDQITQSADTASICRNDCWNIRPNMAFGNVKMVTIHNITPLEGRAREWQFRGSIGFGSRSFAAPQFAITLQGTACAGSECFARNNAAAAVAPSRGIPLPSSSSLFELLPITIPSIIASTHRVPRQVYCTSE